MAAERRNLSRRIFSYYMRVMDEMTGEPVGHFADISVTGFKLDCKAPLPPDMDLMMRVEQMGSIADKNFVVFTARSKWCKRDEYDLSTYKVGFELVNISKADYDIFVKMYDVYGAPMDASQQSNTLRL